VSRPLKGTGFSLKGTGFSLKGTGFSPYIKFRLFSSGLQPPRESKANSSCPNRFFNKFLDEKTVQNSTPAHREFFAK